MGMPNSRDTDRLDLHHLGLRFISPVIESEYRKWNLAEAIPLYRVAMFASLAGYATYLATAYFIEQESFIRALPGVLAFCGLLCTIFALTFFGVARKLLIPMSASANCISGLLLVWQIHELYHSPDRFVLSGTAALIPIMFGFCVYRFQTWVATLSCLPFVVLSMAFLFFDYRRGDATFAASAGMASMQLIAFYTGVFVCAVIDFNNRRTFRKDKIIGMQGEQLQKSRDAIRRYVPPSVADRIINGEVESVVTPTRRRVTILFADMVGFTPVADRLEPEEVTGMLVEFLSGMAERIEDRGGTLNEFLGDGLMALFGAPEIMDPEVQANRAIEAAVSMQALMGELNQQWRKLGLGQTLQIRIGINTGTVSVGSYGSQGRMTYTAMGMQTNIASRIEEAADPGGILISESTYQLVSDTLPCEYRGEVTCKGVHYPVKVYSPRLGPIQSRAPLTSIDSLRERRA